MPAPVVLVHGGLSAKNSPLASMLKGFGNPGVNVLATKRCNLECSHCHVEASPRRKERMRVETARACFENLKPLSDAGWLGRIGFTGGEPLTDVELLKQLVERARTGLPNCARFTVMTNGLALLDAEVIRALEPVKGLIKICILFDSQYHAKFLTPHQIGKIERRLLEKGFEVSVYDASLGMTWLPSAVGRAYRFPTRDLNVKSVCDQLSIQYECNGNSVAVETRMATQMTLGVDENGVLHACCFHTWPLGDLTRQTPQEILEAMLRDERRRAFLQLGPLGAAQVEGKLDAAVEVLRKKGACGVCHALEKKLI